MPCELLLSDHLRSANSISLIWSGRVRVGVLGDAIWKFWCSPFPCPGPTCFPGRWCWIGTGRIGRRFGPWVSIKPALGSLVRVSFLLLSPSLGVLVNPQLIDEIPVCFPWSYGVWCTHCPLPACCSLHHQYYFPYLVLFPTQTFGSSGIQGGWSLMYYGSPLVDSLLDVLDLSYDLLDSYASCWATPNRYSILSSLGSFLDHLPEVRRLL